uniref:Ig-like domain-containing protein n=1 Tax=Paramormyrops kingsleyae TaxID=1676925 RepID=A0A3B3R572_9TELE
EKSMFATEGNDIILPYSFEASDDYFRVTWTCTPNPGRVATFLVNEGRITDVGQDRKMKLLPDCSLQINKLRREDAGLYIGVLKNENRQNLLLNILESKSVTLSCSLHGYDICTDITEREIKFTWFHENGSELNGDTRYHIHQKRCRSALTVTLDQSDHNRNWTCQLTVDGRVKSSASYITTVSGRISASLLLFTPMLDAPIFTDFVMLCIDARGEREREREIYPRKLNTSTILKAFLFLHLTTVVSYCLI